MTGFQLNVQTTIDSARQSLATHTEQEVADKTLHELVTAVGWNPNRSKAQTEEALFKVAGLFSSFIVSLASEQKVEA